MASESSSQDEKYKLVVVGEPEAISGNGTTAASSSSTAIKTMKLYNADRFDKDMEKADAAAAAAASTTLLTTTTTTTTTATQLSQFDSMHYNGNQAVAEAMESARINSCACTVLDIGSGLGGPARLLSEWTGGCHVDALELQHDLHERAVKLTARCGLSNSVKHYCGDILSDDDDSGGLPAGKEYDAIVSFLVFLHIADRRALFEKCWKGLKPGGRMYVEDYVRLDTMTDRERKLLESEVFVPHKLPTWNELKTDLEAQGLAIVSCHDKTNSWRAFVRTREQKYGANIQFHSNLYGTESANALGTFYKAVDELFQGGRLGGVAYTVEKSRI